MQRRILIGDVTYICDLSHRENTEFWSCANAELLAKWLRENGAIVLATECNDLPQKVMVDRSHYRFNGEVYILKQCEGNIFEWFAGSEVGHFTYYYDNIVFKTSDGVIAAHRDDISNVVKI